MVVTDEMLNQNDILSAFKVTSKYFLMNLLNFEYSLYFLNLHQIPEALTVVLGM